MTDILSAGNTGSEFDEREAAKAALEASEEQLQSLCASHAGTFVTVERRGRALQEALQNLLDATKKAESDIESVQISLDQSEDSDKEKSLAVLSERHRVRRRTLLQHSSLLELLELPSLMDACVRSNLYEEALNIASFANTLERRHQDHNQVVHQVISQIRARQEDLRRHLLHRMKLAITMPQCLEIVTALRRLNSIDLERQSEVNLERVHAGMEMRLQVDFLEARDAWLDTQAGDTSTSRGLGLSMNEQLLDAIERYRTRVFEVATQFNAIFRAQQSLNDSVPLLSMWMARRVRSFIELLRYEMSHIEDSAALRDALEASVFFANSMGRLGADFTTQLPEIFEQKMLSLVDSTWKQGLEQLRETLRICREAGVASPLVSQSIETTEPEFTLDNAVELDGPLPPPRVLLAFPPLARLVNAVLTGLNELRRCLLPGIFHQLRKSLDDMLSETKTELMNNERAVLKPGFRGEAAQLREIASKFKHIFSQTIEPYLRGSLEAALGNKEGARCLHEIYLDSIRVTKEDEAQESAVTVQPPEASEEEPTSGKTDMLEVDHNEVVNPNTDIQEEVKESQDNME